MKYKHLFGPVVSRRLGISLGVDVIPYKYCSFNCVYCEVSSTTHLTAKRNAFFPLEQITAELDNFLAAKPKLDYITFSGAGEPTLYQNLGEVINFLKERYPQYKLALITNSTLFSEEQVRKEVLPCDLLLPSLDAGSDEVLQKINRPNAKITLNEIIEGLICLRKEYKGKIWLETFIIPGINDHHDELVRLKALIGLICPDKVQLNSLDRPGVEEWVKSPSSYQMHEIQLYFRNKLDCPVEVISRTYKPPYITPDEDEGLLLLTETLKKHSGTKQYYSKHLSIHVNEVSKLLNCIYAKGHLLLKKKGKRIVYSWKE